MRQNPDCIFTTASDELVSFALTTPLDAMFFLTLNILRMREDAPALAALSAGVTADEESLDRRFAMARARGDARGALDLLAREGGVIALVPDLIMAARDADCLPALLDYCVEKKNLQSWYRPITGFHALLDQLTRNAPAELRARLDILPARDEAAATGAARGATIRLAGILKVHNEGARVTRTVRSMLAFCDDVILWDHCSGDGSIDELERLMRAERTRLEIIRSTTAQYDERFIYDELFARARARGATHICHFDADEILATTLTRDELRQVAAGLLPGDAASLELVQLVGTTGRYLDYADTQGLAAAQYFLPQWRDFLFADDGCSVHAQTHLHGGWLPHDTLRRRLFLDPAQAVNFHMDKPDTETARLKNDWYKAKELVLHQFPIEKLVYRYMFFALTYAYMDKCVGRRPAVDAPMDAAIEAKRTAEKEAELQCWLGNIKTPLEKWLFFHA